MMVALVFVLWQCSSEDFNLAENNPKRNNSEFFKNSSSGGLASRGGVDYVSILEAYNEEHSFLATMPDQEGMPIWEKMRIINSNSSVILVIPLSEDRYSLSSILFASVNRDDYRVQGINNITNGELQRYVFDSSISVAKRESFFYTFMLTDNYTFGTKDFTNIPQDLFVEHKIGEKNNRLHFQAPSLAESHVTESIDTTSKMQIVHDMYCAAVYHCKNHLSAENCDGCNKCKTEICFT